MSDTVIYILAALVKSAIVIGALLTAFAYLTLIERRVVAFMQTRLGPNRAGPFGLLNMVDERCGGTFHNIDDVVTLRSAPRSWQAIKPPRALRLSNSTRRRQQFHMALVPALHESMFPNRGPTDVFSP